MKWVLILWLVTDSTWRQERPVVNPKGSISTAVFQDQASCQSALQAVTAKTTQPNYGTKIMGMCVPGESK